jgi:hypothetical protein
MVMNIVPCNRMVMIFGISADTNDEVHPLVYLNRNVAEGECLIEISSCVSGVTLTVAHRELGR